ncbi:hypothetical protein ABBQ38_014973 [Trebouxia sp. C0009 RCD-2024]
MAMLGIQIGQGQESALKQEVPGQVVKSLKDHGFAWLKMSHEEEQRLRVLKHASEQGNHLDLAGNRIKSKTLLRHTEGQRTRRVPYPLHEAADKVYKLLDIHARRVFEAICDSDEIKSPMMFAIIDDIRSHEVQAASSCLDIIKYSTSSQSDEAGGCEAHLDRGLLSLIWSDSISGLQVAGRGGGSLGEDSLVDVAIPDGYLLVLIGYTLEYATCGIFKAAPHKVTLGENTTTERLSVAFKLRCPGSAVLDFHPDLSVTNGQLAARYQQDVTVHELMGLFENEHPSINVPQKAPWANSGLRGQDLVCLGLSPAWQYAVANGGQVVRQQSPHMSGSGRSCSQQWAGSAPYIRFMSRC